MLSQHATPSLRYEERLASLPLRSHVANEWMFNVVSLVGDYEHHVPPDGCVSLVVRFPAEPNAAPMVLLVGPRPRAFRVTISTLDTYFGLRFWPHAARAILGPSLAAASEYVGPAALLMPELTDKLNAMLPSEPDVAAAQRALHAAAQIVVARSPAVDPIARRAVEEIVFSHGRISMTQLATSLGMSLRQVQRRFTASSGLTLKHFARLRRFRHAAMALLEASPRRWVDVAYDAGYADQAHLSREFSQLVGLTAEELRVKQLGLIHEGVGP